MAFDKIFYPPTDKQPFNLEEDGDFYIRGIGSARKGFITVYAMGDFGGGTLKFQVLPKADDTLVVDVPDGSLTDDGFLNIEAHTFGIAMNLNGATDPDIDIYVL